MRNFLSVVGQVVSPEGFSARTSADGVLLGSRGQGGRQGGGGQGLGVGVWRLRVRVKVLGFRG